MHEMEDPVHAFARTEKGFVALFLSSSKQKEADRTKDKKKLERTLKIVARSLSRLGGLYPAEEGEVYRLALVMAEPA